VEGSTPTGRRTLTPAVLGAALFTATCAIFAITFVAARGGLQMPVAPTGSAVAIASVAPSAATPDPAATTPAQTAIPTPGSTVAPSTAPTNAPSASPAGTPDPLAALPGCPDLPGCYEYLIQRNDTLSRVAARYAIPVDIVLALNPEITDPSTIVVGHILYLGRDLFARLSPCESQPDCSLYTIQPGDRLSTIAGHYGLTLDAVLAANPEITDANAIYSGQVIRLPHPTA
jgi:hypothetical protein